MATENGWLRANSQAMVASNGLQVSSLEYPHLSHDEIFTALEGFYKRFYFRPRKIAEVSYEMLHRWEMTSPVCARVPNSSSFYMGGKTALEASDLSRR
jgi:hypothetical protein